MSLLPSGLDSQDSYYSSEDSFESGRFQDQSGRRFVQMVRNSEYGQRRLRLCFRKPLHTRGNYDVYLMKGQGQTRLHWRLLVRNSDSRITLPVLSVEINTPDMRQLTPIIRRFRGVPNGAEYQGCVPGISMMDIYELADQVQLQMKKYELTSSNCQDFCNYILEKLNLPTHTTTAGGIKNAVVSTAVVAIGVTAARSMCTVM